MFESLEDDLIDDFRLAYTYKIATRRYFMFIILDELGRWLLICPQTMNLLGEYAEKQFGC